MRRPIPQGAAGTPAQAQLPSCRVKQPLSIFRGVDSVSILSPWMYTPTKEKARMNRALLDSHSRSCRDGWKFIVTTRLKSFHSPDHD